MGKKIARRVSDSLEKWPVVNEEHEQAAESNVSVRVFRERLRGLERSISAGFY